MSKTENFVTLFDSQFIPQGLSLYNSLDKTHENFILWVVCVDDLCFDILNKMRLPYIKLILLSHYEDRKLLQIKNERSRAEYCWTITPIAPKLVFNLDDTLTRVTYVDADLYFLKNTAYIFNEFEISNANVLITDHGYDPIYDQSHISGQYCVQFMIFNRKSINLELKWWEDKCIEWCFNRYEDGKFGDQKYLEDMCEIFKCTTHVLSDKSLALAPWNASIYSYNNAIFYHFHSYRIYINTIYACTNYRIPKNVLKFVYLPYNKLIINSIQQVKKINTNIEFKQCDKQGVVFKAKAFTKQIVGMLMAYKNYHHYKI